MRKIREIQKLTQNRPVIILMLTMLVPMFIFMGISIFETGDLTDETSLSLGITALIMGLTFFFVFRMTTMVEISAQGVAYKSMPFSKKLKAIPLHEISHVSIGNHKWWHGYGYRRSFHTQVYAMKPGKVLKVTTNKGKTLQFGLNRPKLVERFIASEWTNFTVHVE